MTEPVFREDSRVEVAVAVWLPTLTHLYAGLNGSKS
jgi:hypothetical protein